MNYYINEYSLRGQFADVEEFFSSIRMHTMPVLKKIESSNDNVILKKETFWQSEICSGISLNSIPRKKNERTAENVALQLKIIKLMNQNPFWSENDECDFVVEKYDFDKSYCVNFSNVNCFTKSISDEGRIISFIHQEYKNKQLEITILRDEKQFECKLENVTTLDFWKTVPSIQTWRIEGKYILEIRANEFDYHPPHFHVTYNEFSAVFKLSDGTM